MRAFDYSNRWLYERVKEDDPKVEPLFAFRGTAYWMRALALLVEDEGFSSVDLAVKYQKVRRKASPTAADTQMFLFSFMAFQNLSALSVMHEVGFPSDLIRNAIISWYYGLYYAASAMVVAADGSIQEEHRGTANTWDRQIVQNHLIPFPFNMRLSTLVRKGCILEMEQLRGRNPSTLQYQPTNCDEAYGACLSSLKGTADFERDRAEERIKTHKNFKQLGVSNFRTKKAQEMRDGYLNRKTVCFLHQASRYRGKANYRDALYLGYGTEYTDTLRSLILDLYTVLHAFLKASSHYCARRVQKGSWSSFVQDLSLNSTLKTSTDVLKV